jgi:hypothetical protein
VRRAMSLKRKGILVGDACEFISAAPTAVTRNRRWRLAISATTDLPAYCQGALRLGFLGCGGDGQGGRRSGRKPNLRSSVPSHP